MTDNIILGIQQSNVVVVAVFLQPSCITTVLINIYKCPIHLYSNVTVFSDLTYKVFSSGLKIILRRNGDSNFEMLKLKFPCWKCCILLSSLINNFSSFLYHTYSLESNAYYNSEYIVVAIYTFTFRIVF